MKASLSAALLLATASSALAATDCATKPGYDGLQTGMSYAQVVSILGCEGEELSTSEFGAIKTVMYMWTGPSRPDALRRTLNAMFQNDRLMSKSQMGLRPPQIEKEAEKQSLLDILSPPKLTPEMARQLVQLVHDQIYLCWSVPPQARKVRTPPVPKVEILLNRDGTLRGQPRILNQSSDALFARLSESALQAVAKCVPFRIPAQYLRYYDGWKTLNINFDASG